MQLKYSVLALAAAGMLSTQVYASEIQVEAAIQPAQPVAAFTDAEIGALFDASDNPMQLAALSEQEMKETEGAWVWNTVAWTAGGGAVGTGIYLLYTPSSQWNWGDAGLAFGSGATSGFYSSVIPLTAFGSVGSYTMGALGSASWYNYNW